MALPKIHHPLHKVEIPSTGQKVSFRPFTVREEKLLMMAKAADNVADSIDAMKQVINNCIIENVDVDDLATFDIEYLFLKLRAKSVGEVVDLTTEHDGEEVKFKVNLDQVEVTKYPEHSKRVELGNGIGVTLRYPNFDDAAEYAKNPTESFIFQMINRCIVNIYDEESVYTRGDNFTEEELNEFILSMTGDYMAKIAKFFDTMPVLEHKVKLKKADGTPFEITLKGVADFF